jgi:predicted permease
MTNGRRDLPLEPDAEKAADLEIEHHIATLTERLIAEGWSEDAARAEAARRFGRVPAVRSRMVRETRAVERKARWWDFYMSIPRDATYAWRGLVRNPAFTIIVVLTLGLGMGAAATVFTVIDALLLRPLPYADADRLIDIVQKTPEGFGLPVLSPDRVRILEQGTPPLESFAYHYPVTFVRTDGANAEQLFALAVSESLDELLGMRPFIGRAFEPEDMLPGVHRVMMTHSYWRQNGADRSIVGKTLRLNGSPYEVIGVLPENFKFPVSGQPRHLWVPLPTDFMVAGAPLMYVNGIGRMAAQLDTAAAEVRMRAVAPPPPDADWLNQYSLGVMPVGQWRGNPELVKGVWLIAAAVALMMLVALTNAMNLILFRGADRVREIAVRLALGVSRMQLLRHILVENVLIALLSGGAAVALAILGVRAVNERLPDEFAFSSAYAFDVSGRVLLFAFVLAAAIGLVLGIIPGLRALRLRFASGELVSARGATRRDTHVSNALVVAEVALSVALLAGAALLTTSFARLTSVDPGLEIDRLALMSVSLPATRYATDTERATFMNKLEAALEARPEVEGATVSNGAPPNVTISFGLEPQAEGGAKLEMADDALMTRMSATPDFLQTTGIRLLSGRDVTPSDVGTKNVLIDESFAQALWGNTLAGRRFRLSEEDPWLTAVGVYGHVRGMGLDDRQSKFGIIEPRDPARAGSFMSVIVRTGGDPAALLPVITQVVRSLDPELPTSGLMTANDAYSDTVDKPRFLARVMAGVGITSLVLAGIGIYGVLGYSVARRRREMGIRMALGAAPLSLGWQFVRDGLAMTAAGIAIGGLFGWWIVRLVQTLLFETDLYDVRPYIAVAVAMLVVAAIAAAIPARVAGRVSPATVLRSD